MLEPHATEIRRELAAVRVSALRRSARPSPAGPLRRALGNGFVRLGLRLGSDGSVPPSFAHAVSVQEVPAPAGASAFLPAWRTRRRRPSLARRRADDFAARARGALRPPRARVAHSNPITLRIPSCRSISSKP